jgi:hypothetical protein
VEEGLACLESHLAGEPSAGGSFAHRLQLLFGLVGNKAREGGEGRGEEQDQEEELEEEQALEDDNEEEEEMDEEEEVEEVEEAEEEQEEDEDISYATSEVASAACTEASTVSDGAEARAAELAKLRAALTASAGGPNNRWAPNTPKCQIHQKCQIH